MSLKIAHFGIDNQFIESTQFTFQNLYKESINDFFIYQGFFNKSIKKSKGIKSIKRIFFHQIYFLREKKLKKYDLIIFHSMNYWNSILSLRIKKKPFLAIIWGGEIYTNTKIKTKFSLENFDHLRVNSLIKRIYYFMQYGYFVNYDKRCNTIKNAIYKAKYISCNELEFDYLKKKSVLNLNASFINLTYYPIEYLRKNFPIKTPKKKFLMVGKSANLAEKNLPILNELIKHKYYKFSKLILFMNLSYGDKKEIIRINKLLNSTNNFRKYKQNNFLSLNQYYENLSRVEIFVFNSKRQQGIGNLIALFYFGAKVFINKENLLYKYYIKLGFKIFTTKDFYNELIVGEFLPLSDKTKKHNKEIVLKNFSLNKNFFEIKKICLEQ